MNPYAYVNGNPETHNDPTGQYYISTPFLDQNGRTAAYVIPGSDLITSVTVDVNYQGSFQDVSGLQTTAAHGNDHIRVQTLQSAIDPYNPDTDANNSPFAKLSRELGWSDLQNTWGNPKATWQDKFGAIFYFLGTNTNNVLQFAMIFGGGPEGDAVDLLNELRTSGANFTESSIVGITRSAETGLLNWLEKGTDASGLTHILARHADDFAKVFGITTPEDVSKLILDTLGNQVPGDINKTLRIFSDVSLGEFTHDLGIVVWANGYIVTAFPI